MRGLLRGLVPLVAALTLVIATSSPVLGGERVTDPAGDGTPDFLAVTTSFLDNEVVFEFEFASDYVPAASFLTILLSVGPEEGCGDPFSYSGYMIQMPTPGRSDVAPSLSANWSRWMPAPIPLAYHLAGPRLTIRVPVSAIGSPEALRFSATVHARAPDRNIDQLPCRIVKTTSPPANPWVIDLAVAGVVVLVGVGIGLLLAWGARRRVPRPPDGS